MIRLPDLPRPLVSVRTQVDTVNLILLDIPAWLLDDEELTAVKSSPAESGTSDGRRKVEPGVSETAPTHNANSAGELPEPPLLEVVT